MKWMKNSNVITVTKSVTSIDSVVTRYLLSSKSEGVTIDGEIWSDAKPYPTSDRKYVWAYETYYYTDRTTGSTQPYIVDTYQSQRFEVTFSSDSYEVHPRWTSDSYFEFSISLLNGLTGTPQFVMVSSSRGIGIPVLDENTGKYLISIANSLDTATSFTFKIIIKDCVETFTIYGKLVDSEAKYIGVVSALPNPEESIDMDYCFLLQSEDDTTGSLYVFSGSLNGWRQINSQDISISDSEKSLMYSVAMKDILEKIPKGSSVFSEFGYFDTIISRLITADYISSKDIKSQNFKLGKSGYRLRSSDGRLDVINANIYGDLSSEVMSASYAEGFHLDKTFVETVVDGEISRAIPFDSFSEIRVNGIYVFKSGSLSYNGTGIYDNTEIIFDESNPVVLEKIPNDEIFDDNEKDSSIINLYAKIKGFSDFVKVLILYPSKSFEYYHTKGSSTSGYSSINTICISSPVKAITTGTILPFREWGSYKSQILGKEYSVIDASVGIGSLMFKELYSAKAYHDLLELNSLKSENIKIYATPANDENYLGWSKAHLTLSDVKDTERITFEMNKIGNIKVFREDGSRETINCTGESITIEGNHDVQNTTLAIPIVRSGKTYGAVFN